MTYFKKIANSTNSWFSYLVIDPFVNAVDYVSRLRHPDFECTSLESCVKGKWQEGPRRMRPSKEVENKCVTPAGYRASKPDTVIDLSFLDEKKKFPPAKKQDRKRNSSTVQFEKEVKNTTIPPPTNPIEKLETCVINLSALDDKETGTIPPRTPMIPPMIPVQTNSLETETDNEFVPSAQNSGRKMYNCVARVPDHNLNKPYNRVSPRVTLENGTKNTIIPPPTTPIRKPDTSLSCFNEAETGFVEPARIPYRNSEYGLSRGSSGYEMQNEYIRSARYSGRKMYTCVTRVPDHKKIKPYSYSNEVEKNVFHYQRFIPRFEE